MSIYGILLLYLITSLLFFQSPGYLTVRDDDGKCKKLCELVEVINPDVIKGKKVISLEVCDPRLKPNERLLMLGPSAFGETESKISSSFGEVIHSDCIDRTPDREKNHGYYHKLGVINALWSSKSNRLKPPLKEKFLSKMRHLNRLLAFGLNESAPFDKSRKLGISKTLYERSACPVLLLKRDGDKPSEYG